MSADLDVAVVVPCHDAARWLPQTLRSVQAQTRPPAELVVVDDGSTDGSADLARELGARCVRQERRGPAAARNHGVRATGAPLVAFLDADDTFLADKLERQVEHLQASGAVLSCADAWTVRDGVRQGRKNAGRGVPAVLGFDELLAGNPIICSTVVVRREALDRADPFDEAPELVATEDWDLWLRLTAVGELAYLDAPLIEYRITPGQLSDDQRFLRGVDRILEKVAAERTTAGLAARIEARRAGVRVDAAYHLARRGRGAEARRLLREARALGAGLGAVWKTWMRSWVGPGRAADERR